MGGPPNAIVTSQLLDCTLQQRGTPRIPIPVSFPSSTVRTTHVHTAKRKTQKVEHPCETRYLPPQLPLRVLGKGLKNLPSLRSAIFWCTWNGPWSPCRCCGEAQLPQPTPLTREMGTEEGTSDAAPSSPTFNALPWCCCTVRPVLGTVPGPR